MTKNNIRIVKVPLPESEKTSIKPQVFPKMPRLYLELMENKSKIKQDLINKDYVPDNFDSKVDNFDSKVDNLLSQNKTDVEKNKYDSDDDSVIKDDSDEEKVDTPHEDKKRYDSDVDISDDDDKSVERKKYDTDDDESEKSAKRSSSSADDLSNRLKELLKDDKDVSNNQKFVKKDKYSRRREDNQPSASYNQPPKLSDIDSGNFNKEYRNIAYEQDDNEDAKREIMFKMELLK